MGLGKSNIVFQVYWNTRMVIVIIEEWRDTSGSTESIIVEKLYKKQEFRPAVLLVNIIYMEILLQSVIRRKCGQTLGLELG